MTGRDAGWWLSAQLLGGYVPFATRSADGARIDDPTRARLDLFLSTAVVGFGQGLGFGAELQLPMGVINASSVSMAPSGIFTLGDLEARARYSLRLGPARGSISAGLALPTGPSIARSGEAAVLEAARYLTLGRGVTWALADLEGRLPLPATFALFLTSTLRVPLADTGDGFRWGSELRGTFGLAAGPWFDRRLSLSLGWEAQWRARSSELDPFNATEVTSVNTGGLWFTLTPSVQVRVIDGVRLFAAGRVPVGQQTYGLQFIPGLGLFVGVAGSFELPREQSAQGLRGAQGQVTVVEYSASWCEPCKKLEPLLSAFVMKRPEVVLRTIDVSNWSGAQLGEAALEGLPVVDVFRADGTLLRRLVGEEVFTFEATIVEALP